MVARRGATRKDAAARGQAQARGAAARGHAHTRGDTTKGQAQVQGGVTRQKTSELDRLLREVSRKDALSSWGKQALRTQEGVHVGKESPIQRVLAKKNVIAVIDARNKVRQGKKRGPRGHPKNQSVGHHHHEKLATHLARTIVQFCR